MKIFEGKSKEERTKIIIAIVVGTLAVLAIGNLIFSPFSGSKKNITVTVSPTPTASPNRNGDTVVTALPKQNEIDDIYTRTPVSVQYPPGAADAGRNIFAFYEPPIPTPYSPTPTPLPVTKTPLPTPPPPIPNLYLTSVNRQSVYAGEKGFRLEVGGDKFTPDTYIFFGGTQLPTKYISPQQLSAELPTNYLVGAGQRTIEVKSADGKLFSNQLFFNIQQPPAPQFQYLGIVSRKRGNNDTAYIMETGKTLPSSVRLGDPIGGRFKLISISPARLLVQDMQLTFLPPYSIDLIKGTTQTSSSTPNRNPNNPFPDPSMVNPNNPNPQNIPGIPNSIPRYIPPQPQPQKDVDDNDDNDN